MKNEVMARAMTGIDYDLIADARAHVRMSMRHPLYRFVAAAAACIVLALGVLVYSNLLGNAEISVGGLPISSEPVAVGAFNPASLLIDPLQRSGDILLTIPLKITPDGKAKIQAKDGSFSVIQTDTNSSVYTGTTYTATETVALDWIIRSPDTNLTYELTVGTKQLMLYFDASFNNWLIVKHK